MTINKVIKGLNIFSILLNFVDINVEYVILNVINIIRNKTDVCNVLFRYNGELVNYVEIRLLLK